MKRNLILSLALASFITGASQRLASAAGPERVQVSHGIAFLPLEFYLKHREELKLSEEQVHEMERILGAMREPGEKLEAEIRERAKALQEAIGQSAVEVDQAIDRFKAVTQAEDEMKMLQFRTRMELRKVLRREQHDKVRDLFAKAAATAKGASEGIMEKLREIGEQIAKRSGGHVPREMMERLEHIEQSARQGHTAEAKEQIAALLRSLSGGKESDPRDGAAIKEQIHKLQEALKNTDDPGKREQIQKQIHKLREARGADKGAEGGRPSGGQELEKQIHRIADAAERTDNTDVREQLRGALARLKEAAAAGNQEVVGDILRSIKPLLHGEGQK